MASNNSLGQDNGFVSFFHKLPEKSDSTVRFFNRTDYYTVHGSDAAFVAQEVFKSTNNVKTIGSGDKKTESVLLNKNQFEQLIRDLLLVKQYRVEVYVGKGNEWSLEYKGSPGNLAQFEDIVYGLDVVAGGTVMAVKAVRENNKRLLGICAISLQDSRMSVCQLEDDEGCTGLEGVLVQMAPKEVVLPEHGDYNTISKVVQRCGCMVVKYKASSFTMDGLSEDLNRLLHWKSGQAENSLALPQLQLSVACSALNAAIAYLEIKNSETNLQQFTLETFTPNQFLHVDAAAAKALGLVSGPGSLLNHLDHCRTGPGKRMLAQWVKQPLRDMSRINDRLSMVDVFVNDVELRTKISDDLLRRFPDLQMLARRIQRKTSSLQDCYKVYLAVERIESLLEALKDVMDSPVIRDEIITPLSDLREDMEKFQEMVKTTLDLERADQGEFFVQTCFSEELAEPRERMDELVVTMEKDLKLCAQELGLEAGKSVKLESTAQLGYFLRITNKKDERAIRNKRDYKIIDGKAGVRFLSPALSSHSAEYSQVKKVYDECQKSIVQEIMNIAAGYSGSIFSLSQVLAKLDVITSFAVTSANAIIPYVRPTIYPMSENNGRLRLVQARHPVMETLDSISFISNNAELDHNGTTFQVITGPNMGGKSTFLRTVGSCVILAHIGCFVPCAEAEMSICDAILARIGAGDCQSAGVSTFMNEMVETSTILKRASCNSLVLIDELGRGTSTYEGCGLAWSIAREIAEKIRAFCLFATHFQELTQLEKEIPSVANWHVSAIATESGLSLLYEMKPGPSDRSFGIEVARMAQLPDHVVKSAATKLTELEQRQGLGISGVNLSPEEIREGEVLVDKFLLDVKTQGVDSVQKLKDSLLAQNHPYIKAILA